jgi:beta-galactosidase
MSLRRLEPVLAELFDGRLLFGAAVYPEVVSEKTFAADAAHMRRLGMNTARIGEFMWAALEPSDGEIRLDVLHRALDILDANGLAAVLCTPTVTPPVWLTHGHPERLHRTAEGIPLGHGSRQHICTNNGVFRQRAARITEALAAAVGNDSRVVAWQLDNEFKSHVGACHCAGCGKLWVQWLEKRYLEVSGLNELWVSAVWSETYQNFGQVPLPGPTPFLHNTALLNEFRLFSQASINGFAREQAAIIRTYGRHPVTHNSGFGFDLDNPDLYAGLDFSSFDTYPAADNHSAFLMNLDYFPQLGAARRTVLMETSTSHGGSIRNYGRPHPHGFVEAEAFATFASGAAGFLFWLFRQHRGGSEQPHGSVVSAWGQPTIGYASAEAIGHLLPRIRPLLEHSRPVQPAVAVHYSEHAKGFLATESGEGADYRSLVSAFHAGLVRAGISRALLPVEGSLGGFRVLFTPFVHHLPEEDRARILDWVRDGGTWVCGPITGDRTANHTWHEDSALGGLEEAAGVESVFQFPATGSGSAGAILGHDVELARMSTFFRVREGCQPGGPTVLGAVTAGPAKDLAFATERRIGAGRMILLGSFPVSTGSSGPGGGSAGTGQPGGPDDGAALAAVVEHACAGVLPPVSTAGDGVVDYPRWRDGRLQHWLVNMGGATAGFRLPRAARLLLSKERGGHDGDGNSDVGDHGDLGEHHAGGHTGPHRPGDPRELPAGVTLPAGAHSIGPYGYLVLEEMTKETAR